MMTGSNRKITLIVMLKRIIILLFIFIITGLFLGFGLGQTALAQSPHGGYTATTDACAGCHRIHVGPNAMMLTYVGNDLCNSCHGIAPASPMLGAASTPKARSSFNPSAISTHSNVGFAGKIEDSFQLGCAQCHESHGDSQNLHGIKEFLPVNPTTDITAGPIAFLATVGSNSYDDGTDSGVCLACHTTPDNPGYPMTNHSGGMNHNNGADYTGVDCITCHPHDADGDPNTPDGFMPLAGLLLPLPPPPLPVPDTEKSFRLYLPFVGKNSAFNPTPSIPNQTKPGILYLPLIKKS